MCEAETPLLELARSIPIDLRAEWETQSGYRMAPVGSYVHRLADEIERLEAERDRYLVGIQDFLEGNYENPRTFRHSNNGQCQHRKYWYEACDECDIAHFEKVLTKEQGETS